MITEISAELDTWVRKTDKAFRALKEKGCSVHGVKPFYTNIRAFDANRKKVMILGINPGGDREADKAERTNGYIDRILDPKGHPFCSIISGHNGEYGAEKQRYATRLRSYLSALLGWDDHPSADTRFCLLPIGNLIPFRSPDVSILEDEAWFTGVGLGFELIELSKPQRVLLIGTGTDRSCWGAIQQYIQLNRCTPVQTNGVDPEVPFCKSCSVLWQGSDQRTEFIAIPHPKFQIRNEDYSRQLKALRDGFGEWKAMSLDNPYASSSVRLTKRVHV